MAQIDKKEYLKKYLSSDAKNEKKKKRKKKPVAGASVMIIDDDVDLSQITSLQDAANLMEANEDAPQVVGVIDDRPMHLRISDYQTNQWKPLGAVEDNENEPNQDEESTPKELVSLKLTTNSFKIKDYDSKSRKSNLQGITIKNSNTSNSKKTNANDSPPRRRRKASELDASPPRKKRVSKSPDNSPPRKGESPVREGSVDNSPPRRRTDLSPVRKKNYDNSPPRRRRQDTDNSPQRRKSPSQFTRNRSPSRKFDKNDSSPPRRQRRNSDNSPPRRKSPSQVRRNANRSPSQRIERNKDMSPPRRQRDTSDSSPPRRKSPSQVRRNANRSPSQRIERDKDMSPPRRQRDTSVSSSRRSNLSSPRRSRFDNPSEERKTSELDFNNKNPDPPQRKLLPGNSKGKYLIPAKRGNNDKMAKTLDGKIAGLQSAKDLVLENQLFRQREDEMFKSMSKEVSGFNAAPIFRDHKTGKKRDLEKEAEERKEKEKLEQENKEKYSRWGRGLKQVQDQEDKLAQDLHEMNKPLARYADDEDLENYLKSQVREGDPMLAFIKNKQTLKPGTVLKQKSGFDFMPNRFGIAPGPKWDGVNRSNGYEVKWIQGQNEKLTSQEETYKWSTEDM